MTSTFKAVITPSLLQVIQKHPIGKGIAELTGFDLESVLTHCSLEVPDESLSGVGWIVIWTSDCVFGLWTAFKKGAFDRTILQEKASDPMENIKAALIFATHVAKNSTSIAFAHDILNRFATLWTFLFVEGVEPTNNLAERGLRPAVIFRKLSGGNQSEWGARFTERLLTVTCTLKQNAKNLFSFLTDVFESHLGARSPPSPI